MFKFIPHLGNCLNTWVPLAFLRSVWESSCLKTYILKSWATINMNKKFNRWSSPEFWWICGSWAWKILTCPPASCVFTVHNIQHLLWCKWPLLWWPTARYTADNSASSSFVQWIAVCVPRTALSHWRLWSPPAPFLSQLPVKLTLTGTDLQHQTPKCW